ncbi:MAG: GNAT family N-acetyltransferase [Candidatus Odinarchaeota archaeon]
MVNRISSEYGEIIIRDARSSDVNHFVELVIETIDREGLESFYHFSREQMIARFKKIESSLFPDYTVALLRNGSKTVTVGYTRLLLFPPGRAVCHFLRGPWISSSLERTVKTRVEETLVEKTLSKSASKGIKVVKAQVPLIFESRLKLLKEDFNFKVINRLFTYTLHVTEKSSNDVPDLPVIRLFSGDEGDAERIVTLHNACFSEDYEMTTEILSFFTKDNHIFIAEYRGSKGKAIAGMVWLEIRKIAGEITGTVSDLVVCPRFRKKGIATALVLKCVEKAIEEGVLCVTAEIADTNQQSIKTFSRCGFVRDQMSGVELLEKNINFD